MLIKDCLDAGIGPYVPNLNCLVGAQTDQMISVFIEREVLNRCVVAVEVSKRSQCEGVPHDDVTLFTATCNEPVLRRIDEGVDTLLVQVKRLVLFVRQLLDVVNMNEAVERGAHNVVEIRVELDLRDPSFVDLLLDHLDAMLLLLISNGLLSKHGEHRSTLFLIFSFNG